MPSRNTCRCPSVVQVEGQLVDAPGCTRLKLLTPNVTLKVVDTVEPLAGATNDIVGDPAARTE